MIEPSGVPGSPSRAVPVDEEDIGEQTWRADGHGSRLPFEWGGAFASAFGGFCQEESLDPVAVLLTGFQVLAARRRGEDRVAVGVPVRTRALREVGPLIRTNPVVADFSAAPSFVEAVRRTEGELRHLLDHPDPDTPAGTEDPGAEPPVDLPPPFGEVFRPPGTTETPRSRGSRVPPSRTLRPPSAFPLTLEVERTGPTIAGALLPPGGEHGSPFVSHLLGQLRTLLEAAVRTPGLPVAALPLESEAELRAAARDADRATDAVRPRHSVRTMVRAHAMREPDSVALGYRGESLSYGRLDELADSFALRLREIGARGSAVAIRLSSPVDRAVAILGAFGAGAAVVPVPVGDTGEQGRSILAETRPVCLVTDLATSDPGALTRWYRESGGRVLDLGGPVPDQRTRTFRDDSVLDEPAYVTHTSGSTGRPKGVPQTQATLAQIVRWMADRHDVGPGSRVAQWAAPTYDASLVEMFLALTSGAGLYPVPPRIRADPVRVLDWLSEEGVTFLQTVPSFARGLVRALRESGGTPPVLHHLLLAGEPLSGELADELRDLFPSARLVNLYGPTESVLATWHEVTGPVIGPVPLGRPIPGRQVLVVDASDRPCPAGVLGEIVVLGPHVTSGYIGGGKEGAARFRPPARSSLPKGWRCYRTGDLGRRRPDGVVEFHGRVDFQVKIAGTRGEITEIETILGSHDSVAECAVVPRADRDGLVQGLTAYVVPVAPAPDPGLSAALRSHLRRVLGSSAPPVLFRPVSGPLPRNPGGKVDRRGLAAYARDPTAGPASPPPGRGHPGTTASPNDNPMEREP
ncbi:AMP-binding protein [Nocardiopsis alba]|uniref:AMP-binding protein n=1 Tax=Nocardiopsis alba TaxID=53437 RepID=UPI0035DE48DA